MGFPPLRVCAGICEPKSIITTTKASKSLRWSLCGICNPFGSAVILIHNRGRPRYRNPSSSITRVLGSEGAPLTVYFD